MINAAIVYVVDDEDSVREGLRWLFASVRLEVADFATIEAFQAAYSPDRPGCLLLDVRMPGTSGLDLLDDLVSRDVPLPVIFLSGHGDIQTAVWAVQHGALDFIPKPGHEQTILRTVQEAVRGNAECLHYRRQRAEVERRFGELSERENEVIRLVASAHLNKQIGDKLAISERTVETHRMNALRKLNVKTGAELFRLASMLTAPACPKKSGKLCPACRAVG